MEHKNITEMFESIQLLPCNDWDEYEEYDASVIWYKDDIFRYSETEEKTTGAKEKTEKELQYPADEKEEDTKSQNTLITPKTESSSEETSSASSTHLCLKEINISDSQLQLSNLYTTHPVPDDPGLETAFWKLESKPPIYSEDGVAKFYDLIHSQNLKSIQIIGEMLFTNELDLQYYGINPRAVKALCDALEDNTYIETINFTDNRLSDDSCYHLNSLLLRNTVIKTVILSNCQIKSAGAKRLQEGLSVTTASNIDLSGCNIGDNGLSYISKSIMENHDIEILNLCNNQLTQSSAECITDLLASDGLQWLNLSWNHLHTEKFWKIVGKGLTTNKSLVSLNLSWNSLGSECIPYLCAFLSSSETLKELRLDNNRLYEIDVATIGKALTTNTKLEELYIGNNPINTKGAFALLSAISSEELVQSSLRLLDLENVWGEKNCIPELNKIKENKPWLNVKLGGILSNYKIVGPCSKKIFLQRAIFEGMKPKKKKLQKNMDDFIDSLQNTIIPADFIGLIKKFKLKLSESLINEIVMAFATPQNTIDQVALKLFYWQHFPRKETEFLQLGKRVKQSNDISREG